MTLNDLEPSKQRFLVNCSQFLDATHISTLNSTKWLEIAQDNLHIKFSALNVDFSSSSPDPLDSRRPAQAGIKDSYPTPLKTDYFTAIILCSMRTVAYRHRHAAYYDKQ